MIEVKNLSTEDEIILVQVRIGPEESYEIPPIDLITWATNDSVLQAISDGSVQVYKNTIAIETISEQIKVLTQSTPNEVRSTSELVCSWSCLKNFIDNNSLAHINYFEKPTEYFVWIEYRNQKMYIPSLLKNTDDCIDFETNYKDIANIDEAPAVRITTCRKGRRLHERYITLVTANQDSYDNTDWQENDYGDVTYIMKDINGDTTTNNSSAKETWIDWLPPYDYEIAGGKIFVPSTLAGGNDDAWEVHVVAAPDISRQLGGNIHLIANPRIKWLKGQHFGIDSTNHPAYMQYDPVYYSSKIRLVIKHPVGAQSEFQFNIKAYR